MKKRGGLLMGRVSLKSILMLSLALNVGFISRLAQQGDFDQQKNIITTSTSTPAGFICSQDLEIIINQDTATTTTVFDEEKEEEEDEYSFVSSTSAPTTTSMDGGDGGGDGGGGVVINLDHGDPTMYKRYWQQMGNKTTVVISGGQYISYFSDVGNICWFLEPEFANAVIRLHNLVGNAETEGRYIVVGTGSSQLYQAVLYALATTNSSEPFNVVSAAPFYSSYPLMTDYLKSGLYRWAGDAYKFNSDEPYIELVTSPNNPDGTTREAVINKDNGLLVHDLAYYWPQYTPVSLRANHDIMLFTVSKSTGHAGTRIGWALIKDQEIAKKMTKFIEINTIGVSKDSQVRAAKILHAVSDSHSNIGNTKDSDSFFEYSFILMEKRWKDLRQALKKSGLFSLPEFPSRMCTFSGRAFETQPAFAWLKCEGEIADCESFLGSHNIIARGGKHFGVGPEYVRISMLDTDEKFNMFTARLSQIHS